MSNDGLIISDATPVDPDPGSHTWLKISPNGSRDWYVSSGAGGWTHVKAEAAPNTFEHATHGNINFTGTVSADGLAGITGEFEGTFKKIKVQDGIVVEFELG